MPELNAPKHIFLTLMAVLLILGWSSTAWGVHKNIPCEKCHDKTEAQLKGYTHDPASFPVSDVCLSCHDADLDVSGLSPPYVVSGKRELAGGSFTPTLFSDAVGHNMISVDQKLGLTPPGGTTLIKFGCLSCHDGHENGNYRSLKKEINGHTTIVAADSDPEFQQNAYKSGMSDFCGACHIGFNRTGSSRGAGAGRRHPVGIRIAGAEHADVEHWSRLADKLTQAQYPSGNPNNPYDAEVFCLTCHRAHASPFNDAMRWDYSQNAQGCRECHTF